MFSLGFHVALVGTHRYWTQELVTDYLGCQLEHVKRSSGGNYSSFSISLHSSLMNRNDWMATAGDTDCFSSSTAIMVNGVEPNTSQNALKLLADYKRGCH